MSYGQNVRWTKRHVNKDKRASVKLSVGQIVRWAKQDQDKPSCAKGQYILCARTNSPVDKTYGGQMVHIENKTPGGQKNIQKEK